MKKVCVVINEQNKLLPSQEKAIQEAFGQDIEIERFNIPKGLTVEQQQEKADILFKKMTREKATIIFASSVPVLMARTVFLSYWASRGKGKLVYLLHNDKRKKKKLVAI